MPRQNFLSRECFVSASETVTRASILSIPVFAPNIQLQSENVVLQSYRFLLRQSQAKSDYFMDVTVLPLNEEYTRVCLHATRTDGQAFQQDGKMALALHDFEDAVLAAVSGDTSLYQPRSIQENKNKGLLRSTLTLLASVSLLVLRKKLS